MGQRANLIILADGKRETYYTHHRANTLDRDLFWGPNYALEFIRAQRRVDPDELLDELWAEGGAVMDTDKKYLLWFGGEDVLCEIPIRRVHAKTMAALWPGWSIRWASEGVGDIADYLGVSRAKVISEKCAPMADPLLSANDVLRTRGLGWGTLASIQHGNLEARVHVLQHHAERILYVGEAIIVAAEQAQWATTAALNYFPAGGFHIDVSERSIALWNAYSRHNAAIHSRVQSAWPCWTVQWHQDRFEPHAQLLANAVDWPMPKKSELLQHLATILLRPEDPQSGAEQTLEIARLLAKEQRVGSVQVNQRALYDARLELTLEQRRQLFSAAVAMAFP